MPLMQRHVDIYRHKVIMGIHNRPRRDKFGETAELDKAEGASMRISQQQLNLK